MRPGVRSDSGPPPPRRDLQRCTANAETLYGGLHNQPRYTFRLVAPEGAPRGDVWVSEIVVRAYYITGFVEAGHFE